MSNDPYNTRAASSQPFTVLLVEDHKESASALGFLLRYEGFTVRCASNVNQALHLAAHENVDIVVSDIRLPDGDGCDLMAQLHSRYGLQGIAVTGWNSPDLQQRFRESGFVQCLEKPIDFTVLLSAVDRCRTSLDVNRRDNESRPDHPGLSS
jgi:CheY-like chemotaxis protein